MQDTRDTCQFESICAWLLAISTENKTEDVYWNVDDYTDPKIFNADTKEEYDPTVHYDEFDYDSFRLAITNITFVLSTMDDYPETRLRKFVKHMETKYRMKVCMKKMLIKLKKLVEHMTYLKNEPSAKRKYPEEFYPLLTSTPNKKRCMRTFEMNFPRHEVIAALRVQDENIDIVPHELGRAWEIPNDEGILAGMQVMQWPMEAIQRQMGAEGHRVPMNERQYHILKSNLNARPRDVGTQTIESKLEDSIEIISQDQLVERPSREDRASININHCRSPMVLEESSEEEETVRRQLFTSRETSNDEKDETDSPVIRKKNMKSRKFRNALRATMKGLSCSSECSERQDSEVAGPSSPRSDESQSSKDLGFLMTQDPAKDVQYLDSDTITSLVTFAFSGNQECMEEVEAMYPGITTDPELYSRERRVAAVNALNKIL